MSYNMSAFEASNNVLEMFIAVDNSTNHIMALLSLIALFAIMTIILLRNNPPAESIVASSATTTVFSLVLLAIGVVTVEYVIGAGLIFAIAGVALYLNRQ